MVISAFNFTYFLLFALMVLSICLLTRFFKNKSNKSKENLIIGISIFNIIFYVVYKFILYFRTPGIPNSYEFIVWKELPLHLCNISLILIPLGVKLKNDGIMSYGFFVSPLGAFFALTFPSIGFGNLNIFYPHMIGYYGTHTLLIVTGILLVTLKLYTPAVKKLRKTFVTVIVLSIFTFVINLLIKNFTGVTANYFYTVEPEGISILELFWSIIPIPFLYLSFALVILLVYSLIITLPIEFALKKKNNK